MITLHRLFGIVFALLLSASAWAEAPAVVEAVQKSAWLTRQDTVITISAGTEIQSGDRIHTGADSRVVLRFTDKSLFKIGEYAKINFDRLQAAAKQGEAFQGVIEVTAGAIRYTSTTPGERDIKVKVGTATAGIRGTDVWGKSGGDKDFICLLEGKISVSSGDTSAELTQPLQFFVVPKGQAPLPVSFLEEEKLKKWALETELTPEGVK
jgi:hypothetical protein